MTGAYGLVPRWQKAVAALTQAACPLCGEMVTTEDAERRQHIAACEALAANRRLEELEDVIQSGLKVFYEVGMALLEIRDNKLYQPAHKTFEDYCQKRWHMKRAHAYRLMEASEVVKNLSPFGDIPAHETHVRPLASLAAEEQVLVWQVIKEPAPGGNVTEAHARSVVNVLKEVTSTGAIDDGSGEQIPPAQATLTHLKAAVTEETYERLKRQETYISEKLAKKAQRISPVMLATDESEWYTPVLYMDAVRSMMNGIDLDPASHPDANINVQAQRFYTRAEDGLTLPWYGRVWLNPPYGGQQVAFIERLIAEYQTGNLLEAVLLVNSNSTDTRWFQPLWNYSLCFTNHRIDFIPPAGRSAESNSTHGSVFVYLGQQHAEFVKAFQPFGAVVRKVTL